MDNAKPYFKPTLIPVSMQTFDPNKCSSKGSFSIMHVFPLVMSVGGRLSLK